MPQITLHCGYVCSQQHMTFIYLTLLLHLVNGVVCRFSSFYSSDLAAKKENFYSLVLEHKEVRKIIAVLKTAITTQKSLTAEALKKFSQFQMLWDVDKNLKVKVCFP